MPLPDFRNVIKGVLTSVAGAAAGEVGSYAAGYLLSAVLGVGQQNTNKAVLDDLEDIQDTLKNVETEIQQLSAKVDSIGRDIIFATTWTTLSNEVTDHATNIESWYRSLNALGKADTAKAQHLRDGILDENTGALATLLQIKNRFINDGPGNPGQVGLLQMWIDKHTEKAGEVDANAYGPGSPLATAVDAITTYFKWAVGLQVKGIVLLCNALRSEPGASEKTLFLEWEADIAVQAEIYRSGMEHLLVSYCVNQRVIGIMGGSDWMWSPVLIADQTITNMSRFEEIVVRIWGGLGTGDRAFSTGNYHLAAQPAPAIYLVQGGVETEAISPEPAIANSYYKKDSEEASGALFTAFKSRDAQSAWSMYRAVFRVPAKAATYHIKPDMPNGDFYDCFVDRNHYVDKYQRFNPTWVTNGVSPASLGINLTGRGHFEAS